ncbi:tRNA-5-taurinomethyluridine 2-sulfurtransferase NDAI_0A06680 [Naumovozyma dairenensis CBS 421]|uniref:tRNA-5-taurinomethyluridine 2-sulfurtransferase n=1 Tax=Naumovozyma dairenensis (strain ATCC 10597 / BCRC 20456 / CBS 421 / NBRC 0211 / NRRL Y-12639) TaxID=1071378 RepID=G0W4T4_NAUDC|nr:hypothetical protein NDAI_0A06680 [Naumovozyma dairenensis CBS 421]CCD22822.1 hypothetical protein NDAI_0A06680 [Naumovozyma dairenensis CBS 421]
MISRFKGLITKRVVDGYKPIKWPSSNDTIVIAMSSGVDSSVAALLFSELFPNCKIKGIYMSNWSQQENEETHEKGQCYERDWKDVCQIGKYLNIPVDFINFEKDYWMDVFEPMLHGYQKGITPNPDIGCNKFIKFGKLFRHLNSQYGKDNYRLVTGHYARILQKNNGDFNLLRSYYKNKDQSYYMSQISPSTLPNIILPIGHMTKPEVREIANFYKLPTANKPDSQGICFVNNSQHGSFKNFLQNYIPENKGDIITILEDGKKKRKWGEHTGLWSYTVGQKIGLSMPQGDHRFSGAWYVSDKLKSTNELVIVRGRDNPALYKNTVKVRDFCYMGADIEQMKKDVVAAIKSGMLTMQYRSLQEPVRVKHLSYLKDGDDSTVQELGMEVAQRAMAPGQYCCLYIGDTVIGSGTII